MTENDEARDDRKSVRDTVLQIIAATATPIVGMVVTNSGNPRSDQILMTWVVLAVFAIAAIVTLSFVKSRRADRYVTQAQYNDVLGEITSLTGQVDKVLNAQQQLMRHDLISRAAEYMKRSWKNPDGTVEKGGWVTPEEHRMWSDMYASYETLGLNGYMRTYMEKVDKLPMHTLEEVAEQERNEE